MLPQTIDFLEIHVKSSLLNCNYHLLKIYWNPYYGDARLVEILLYLARHLLKTDKVIVV